MKKLIIALMGCYLISCSSGIEGEGAATAHKEFKSEGFSSLEVSCNCDVILIPSDSTKIVVESHQNLVDNLEVSTKGKDLFIKENKSVDTYDLYNVIVYFNPDLKEVELKKQSNLKISGTLKANAMKFDLTNQTSIAEAFLEVTNLELNMDDQSKAQLTGTVITLEIDSSDEAMADLTGLQAVEVEFSASDKSQLKLHALKDLKGKASENAVVSYKGDPKKDTTEKDKALIQQN